jgi:hypothetical protein
MILHPNKFVQLLFADFEWKSSTLDMDWPARFVGERIARTHEEEGEY